MVSNVKAMFVVAGLFVATPALADDLTIIDQNGRTHSVFSRADIEKLGTETLHTVTPWTNGRVAFTGVSLMNFLDAAGLKGADVAAVSMDDYVADISWETMQDHAPMIATRLDGQPLSVENKGPFWIMFDFEDAGGAVHAALRTMAVWHLVEFEVQ